MFSNSEVLLERVFTDLLEPRQAEGLQLAPFSNIRPRACTELALKRDCSRKARAELAPVSRRASSYCFLAQARRLQAHNFKGLESRYEGGMLQE